MPEQNAKNTVRIDLTPTQVEQVKRSTGREVTAIELTVQDLEARIAPSLTMNHNESLLVDD